jgi:hypothetical protein
LQRLPSTGSGWPIRIALSLGLICLLALLFEQPYRHSGADFSVNAGASPTGVMPADAERLQGLQGWHVARADDFSASTVRFLHERGLPLTGRVLADFTGRGSQDDAAYLLVNSEGKHRVSMLAGGSVAYDAIFPRVDALVRIPKQSLGNIKWKTSPQNDGDGDGLLVIQDADDPTASLVLLRHGTDTYSARPLNFSQIDLAPQ